MQIQPYLFFEGRCDEAIAFYKQALNAEVLMLMRYKDSPSPANCPADPTKVMHATLKAGDAFLNLSDGMCSGTPTFTGTALSLQLTDPARAAKLFDALAAGGTVVVPLAETFFAHTFGMLHDKFGVHWMVYVPKS